jgi:thiamine-phosphate pyrophosphorylase
VEAGLKWVQLRDHILSDARFEKFALELADRLWAVAPDLLISINSRVDVASKLRSGSNGPVGLHLGMRGPSLQQARSGVGADMPIGTSAHDHCELSGYGWDYFLWSPVFETMSKPGAAATGTESLAAAVDNAKVMPVIALGGISPKRAQDCLEAGAHGIAVLSGILDAEDPGEITSKYLLEIEAAQIEAAQLRKTQLDTKQHTERSLK